MDKQLQFKQIVAVFNDKTRETDLYGLMESGGLYKQRRNAEEGWESVSTHLYEQPEPEKPVSKSMQWHKSDEE